MGSGQVGLALQRGDLAHQPQGVTAQRCIEQVGARQDPLQPLVERRRRRGQRQRRRLAQKAEIGPLRGVQPPAIAVGRVEAPDHHVDRGAGQQRAGIARGNCERLVEQRERADEIVLVLPRRRGEDQRLGIGRAEEGPQHAERRADQARVARLAPLVDHPARGGFRRGEIVRLRTRRAQQGREVGGIRPGGRPERGDDPVVAHRRRRVAARPHPRRRHAGQDEHEADGDRRRQAGQHLVTGAAQDGHAAAPRSRSRSASTITAVAAIQEPATRTAIV